MGRSPCCSKVGLRRGPWSSKEDAMLTDFIQKNGEGQWRSLPKKAGLLRCGKSCRLRWMNYLRPGIKRGNIGEDEEDLIVRLHGLLGNRWSLIAGRLPGRTDNEIKNYWNTHLLKKLNSAGIQQNSHKELPKSNKSKKSQTKNDAVKKKQKQKKNKKADANAVAVAVAVAETHKAKPEETPIDQLDDNGDDPPKIKVYLPKPIRITPSFPRVNSYDSLGSRTSSSDGGETAEKTSESYAPVELSTFLELEDFPFVDGVDEDEFLGGGYILPVLHHSDSISSDTNMLDIMLDEFRQLV